jgi:hypothetical protein
MTCFAEPTGTGCLQVEAAQSRVAGLQEKLADVSLATSTSKQHVAELESTARNLQTSYTGTCNMVGSYHIVLHLVFWYGTLLIEKPIY